MTYQGDPFLKIKKEMLKIILTLENLGVVRSF